MTKQNTVNKRRLFRLLDRIVGEERNFKRRSAKMRSVDAYVQKQLHNIASELTSEDDLVRIKNTHEALFNIHRRFMNDHELILQRCFLISRQVRSGLLNEEETSMEIERLTGELKRLKSEHEWAHKQSLKILSGQDLINTETG